VSRPDTTPPNLKHWAQVSTGPFHFAGQGKRIGPRASGDWRTWVAKHFPHATSSPFADRHVRLWEWFEMLNRGVRPVNARVELWPRGGGKSSTVELATTRTGARQARKFCLYISKTQAQANKHLQDIAPHFTNLGIGRAIGPYGSSLGWRVDMLRCDNGFNVLALGLDSAARGLKIEGDRPDLFVFDDVDDRDDTEDTVNKKISTITQSVLPAESTDAAVLFVQNVIHSGSIAAKLLNNTADFLLRREVFCEPALTPLSKDWYHAIPGTVPTQYKITDAVPTWAGQSIETCEAQMNTWGRAAFLREAQHETDESEDGLWNRERDLDPFREKPVNVPDLFRIVVGIDPNATEGGDEAGIAVGGVARIKGILHAFVLEDASTAGGPATWAKEAVAAFKRWDADRMVAESNNGGEMVAITIGTVPDAPKVKLIHASRGKRTRAEPVQKLYEDGRVHHVGTFVALEKELCTWEPGDPSPNRLDALVWLITELLLTHEPKPRRSLPTSGNVSYK